MPAWSQTKKAIIEAFRERKVSYVVEYSDLPFSFNGVLGPDDASIATKADLTQKLEEFFRRSDLRDLLKGRWLRMIPCE
jgi:hypothetical protein